MDYFRGIMALSVLIYHYTFWTEFPLIYPLDQMFARLGLYAVSAFYVLSGASLALVYYNKKVNFDFIKDFSVKRVFRIAPLFYLVTTATIILGIATSILGNNPLNIPGISTIVLNYTLTFGWLSPDSYIATGAWSIGNELVFYSVFPIMLFLIKKSYRHFWVFAVMAIITSFFISEILIDRNRTFESQWRLYINPLNQLYLFVGGFLIGYLLKAGKQIDRRILLVLAVFATVVFVFLPSSNSDSISLIVGTNKIIFSLAIFIMCLFAAFWGNVKQNVGTKLLKYFGDISYAVYLIHPLMYTVVVFALQIISVDSATVIILISVIGTLIVSTLVYRYVEMPFINIGKRVSNNAIKDFTGVKTEASKQW